MSNYNWCHGPKCHERKTTTRVRGVKGSKVLRTMKIMFGRIFVAQVVGMILCTLIGTSS